MSNMEVEVSFSGRALVVMGSGMPSDLIYEEAEVLVSEAVIQGLARNDVRLLECEVEGTHATATDKYEFKGAVEI